MSWDEILLNSPYFGGISSTPFLPDVHSEPPSWSTRPAHSQVLGFLTRPDRHAPPGGTGLESPVDPAQVDRNQVVDSLPFGPVKQGEAEHARPGGGTDRTTATPHRPRLRTGTCWPQDGDIRPRLRTDRWP